MENTPEAPVGAVEAPKSVETPTNNMPEQAPAAPVQMPDMHGFTSDQLADMKKFFDNNGGFDGVKAKISNPVRPAENPVETQQAAPREERPTSHIHEPVASMPQGAITPQEFLAEQYFKSLAGEEKYSNISAGIANGDYLKEMAAFGIQPLNMDGSINDQKVRMYLDLKSQTVPAKPTSPEPNASSAPTVTYTPVGDKIDSIDQAYKIILEPGNPAAAKAEEFIRTHFNPNSGKTS